MGLLDDVKEIFGEGDLYKVFGVAKDADVADIRKAYRKLSLLCHPDKADVSKREQFTKKFQILSKCYDILQDDDKRKIYDETGCVDDEAVASDRDWEAYWRNLFPKITVKQIEKFYEEYRGSDDEVKDLKRHYETCKGSLNKLMQYHLGFVSIDDEDRITDMLKDLISSGDIKDYPAFSKESAASKRKRRRWFESEAKEAADDEQARNSMSDLAMIIQENQKKRASDGAEFLAALEAKYASKAKRRSKS